MLQVTLHIHLPQKYNLVCVVSVAAYGTNLMLPICTNIPN